MHPFARKAAAAALAAQAQGKFWELHRKLFQEAPKLSDVKIQEIAKELKLDLDKFNKEMSSPAVQKLIDRDLSEGGKAEIPGTPTIFVNGKLVKERSAQGFLQMIENELKKAKQAGAKP